MGRGRAAGIGVKRDGGGRRACKCAFTDEVNDDELTSDTLPELSSLSKKRKCSVAVFGMGGGGWRDRGDACAIFTSHFHMRVRNAIVAFL